MGGARAEGDALEIYELAGVAAQRHADARERLGALERREVGDQKARPRRLLEIALGERASLAVEAGRLAAQREQPCAREGDLLGQPARVGGCAQAGQERGAIAVVVGAQLAPHAHAAALPARARRPPGGRRSRGCARGGRGHAC